MTTAEEVPYTPQIGDIAVRTGGGTGQYKVVGVWAVPDMPLRVSLMYMRDNASTTGWLPADNFVYTPTVRSFTFIVPQGMEGSTAKLIETLFDVKVQEATSQPKPDTPDERLYGVIFKAITESDAGDSRWWDLTQRKAATDKVFEAVKKEIGQ